MSKLRAAVRYNGQVYVMLDDDEFLMLSGGVEIYIPVNIQIGPHEEPTEIE